MMIYAMDTGFFDQLADHLLVLMSGSRKDMLR